MSENILQYESKIWSTADTLRGSGIKESEWPSMMMPFFALMMVESRLVRMFGELQEEIGHDTIESMDKEDLYDLIKDRNQGYNAYIFEKEMTLADVCKNDKTFETDFTSYLRAFDGETKDLLGVDATDGDKFLDIHGVITKMKAKKKIFGWVKGWSEIDLCPFDNSEITTLEEHIKRKWADISAETAGEQYTPDDIISLIAEIVASKVEDDSDKLLKIYDCTCGGGNLLFGVEDRIKEKFNRFTATYGQDWNDSLYALARIESRFRPDSKIEYGNTLNNDKFPHDEFDVCIANPPYGVDWKDDRKSIEDDKTGRFHYLPSVKDGQLLFMQHLISKLNDTGVAVVVHNGSSLHTGDAGSSESNIRKWMLDNDLVEAVIQNPSDEFFNTPIYTYLWIINKNKPKARKDKVILIDASEKYTTLGKKLGDKGRYIDDASRKIIVETLIKYESNDFAKVYSKYHFYYNKQGIELTNLDKEGKTFVDHLPMKAMRDGTKTRVKSIKLEPISLSNGEITLNEFEFTETPSKQPLIDRKEDDLEARLYDDLKDAFNRYWKPLIATFDYKDQDLTIITKDARYHYDEDKETLIKTIGDASENLGCGKILVKVLHKKSTSRQSERIVLLVEITGDKFNDSEFIPYKPNRKLNEIMIDEYLNANIHLPFIKTSCKIGVEINFIRYFFSAKKIKTSENVLGNLRRILDDIDALSAQKEDMMSEWFKSKIDDKHSLIDSGVDWLGVIPKDWKIERIGTAFLQRSEKVSDKDYPPLSVTKNGVVPQLETAVKTEDGDNRKKVVAGDYVINSRSDRRGSSGLSEYTGSVSLINIVLKPKEKFCGRFLHHLFRSHSFIEEFYRQGKGMVDDLWTTKYSTMKSIMFAYPDYDEQKRIADEIDSKIQFIDNYVLQLRRELNELSALRISYISEKATGKIT